MVDCIKQQKEVHYGNKVNRCINRKSPLALEIVTDEQCANCPLLKVKKKRVPCDKALKDRTRMINQMNEMSLIEYDEEGYPPCPFRGGGKCSITGMPIDAEICNRCNKDTREHEAKFGEKVKNYFGAVRRWVAKGKPTRSEEEIKKLFKEHCSGCERYDKEKHACKNCGCSVSTSSSPLENKLGMASAHCPLGRW